MVLSHSSRTKKTKATNSFSMGSLFKVFSQSLMPFHFLIMAQFVNVGQNVSCMLHGGPFTVPF